MRASIYLIRLSASIAAVFLILAYSFSTGCIDFPLPSADFLFGMTSGVSASALVVVATEIRQYLSKKEEIEMSVYMNSLCIYRELSLQIQAISFLLENKDALVSDNILYRGAGAINLSCTYIQSHEYVTFFSNNRFSVKLKDFRDKTITKLAQYLVTCYRLPESIARTKIALLENGQSSGKITSSYPLVRIALTKLREDACAQSSAISSFLKAMETAWPKRFSWTDDKAGIDSIDLHFENMAQEASEFFNLKC